MGFLEKANAGVWGIECDAGGAGAKLSIQGPDRKVGTERVEARLRDDGGDRPPANESCMEWQGLATQRDPDKKKHAVGEPFTSQVAGGVNLIAEVGLVRACESLFR
jgi:hypothetical protein